LEKDKGWYLPSYYHNYCGDSGVDRRKKGTEPVSTLSKTLPSTPKSMGKPTETTIFTKSGKTPKLSQKGRVETKGTTEEVAKIDRGLYGIIKFLGLNRTGGRNPKTS
jgi:hypothetical protein